MHMAKALGIELPTDAPTFGNIVLVRNAQAEDQRFVHTSQEGVFLCGGASVIQGAYVMSTREDGETTTVAATGPIPWPNTETDGTWHVEQEPGGDTRTWMSNTGILMWTPPDPEETVTCEERTDPDGRTGVEQLVLDMDSYEDRHWRRCYHTLEVESASEEEVDDDDDGALLAWVPERGFPDDPPREVPVVSYHPQLLSLIHI